ncbi:putative beta-glucosidase L [Grifola frondosa]|uniref:beta-glucosidase n=1 Tax=Grifola frondosa TaxID=5627 RepID=A0A1C7MP53_GRIFR|nr:putative beta-glucosidase L [Grifola frondosa]
MLHAAVVFSAHVVSSWLLWLALGMLCGHSTRNLPQQCGGSNQSTCSTGYVCQQLNETYQCLPDAAFSATSASSTMEEHMLRHSRSSPIFLCLKKRVLEQVWVYWEDHALELQPPSHPFLDFLDYACKTVLSEYDMLTNIRISRRDKCSSNVQSHPHEATRCCHGAEFRGKGVNVALGPMMNLMRAPAAGRNWEGGGGDPYLSGEVAFETIQGIQSEGVQACAKHFINNEQEHFRQSSSSNVDDRTEHELYAHPFLRSVQANVAAVMCSYNQINGTFACENSATLSGILKGELGFQGYVTSEQMTMPGDEFFGSFSSYFGQNLVDAVNSGNVSQARIDDLATRILAGWFLLGQDSGYPAVNFNSWLGFLGEHVNVQGDHANIIRTIGAASTILLKNKGSVLPLNAPRSIAVIGSGAGSAFFGPNECLDRSCDDGVLAMGWGSGYNNYPYLIAPVDALTARAELDGTTVTSSLSDSDLNGAATAALKKDVAFVFLTADSGEASYTVEGNAGDRNDLNAWHGGDALVQEVAGVNNNTVVVVNSVGPIIVDSWIEHPNVTALVWSGIPGQEAGNALVDVLYGAYNPSGRLPFTIAKNETDYSARVIYDGSGTVQIPYSEGLLIDYRHFDAANITPRFEFGFGLSTQLSHIRT